MSRDLRSNVQGLLRFTLLVYGTVTDLWLLGLITDVENENKGFMAHWMEGIFEPSRTRSSSMDMELIRVISPLNTPTTDAAPEIWLHNSAKVQGSLNMEEKSTVNGAEELQSGARKKIPTDKGKQYEIQRLKDRRTVALRHATKQNEASSE